MCVEPPRLDLPVARYCALYFAYLNVVRGRNDLGCGASRGHGRIGSRLCCDKSVLGLLEHSSGDFKIVDRGLLSGVGTGGAKHERCVDEQSDGPVGGTSGNAGDSQSTSGASSGSLDGTTVRRDAGDEGTRDNQRAGSEASLVPECGGSANGGSGAGVCGGVSEELPKTQGNPGCFDEFLGEEDLQQEPGVVEPEGLVSDKTLRNRERRAKARARKVRKQARQQGVSEENPSSVPEWRRKPVTDLSSKGWKEVDVELQESIKKKWVAQNKLRTLEAERKLAILQANDVEDEISQYRTRNLVIKERNLVTVEKLHNSLRASGNVTEASEGQFQSAVSSESGTRVQTVLSGVKSGSISPNSSISDSEVWALKKAKDEAEEKAARLERQIVKMGGVVSEYSDKFDFDKRTWTDTSENMRILEDMYPGGVVTDRAYCAPGRFEVLGGYQDEC